MALPLNLTERNDYIDYAIRYRVSNKRYLPNTTDYNIIVKLENKNKAETDTLRQRQNLNIPSLTYVAGQTQQLTQPLTQSLTQPFTTSTMITPLFTSQAPTLTPQRGEIKPIIDTTIGLPPGTTNNTNESFISKYKIPLIIGAVGIGYMLLKKK